MCFCGAGRGLSTRGRKGDNGARGAGRAVVDSDGPGGDGGGGSGRNIIKCIPGFLPSSLLLSSLGRGAIYAMLIQAEIYDTLSAHLGLRGAKRRRRRRK